MYRQIYGSKLLDAAPDGESAAGRKYAVRCRVVSHFLFEEGPLKISVIGAKSRKKKVLSDFSLNLS